MSPPKPDESSELSRSSQLEVNAAVRANPEPQRQDAASETVEGCEGLASADLDRAAGMDTQNGRLRMERSARSWAARARMLESEGGEAHRANLRAEWAEGEDDDPA